jgi:hypothetical protein
VGGRQRDAQAAADQHHDHVRRRGLLGQELRVPGKGDAGVVDDAFLNRSGHHRLVLSPEAALHRALEHGEDIRAVRRIEAAGRAGAPQRDVRDFRKALEEAAIADGDHARREALSGEHAAQLRSDARGLARGQRDDRGAYRSSSRSSTYAWSRSCLSHSS